MLRKRIVLAPFFMVVVLITLLYIHPPETVSAATGVQATIKKATGDLEFTLTATPASSSTNPHWQTIGFYITKNTTGHNGKSDTKSSDCIFFDRMPAGCKKDETKKDGLVYTKFTIPKKYVLEMCDKAKVDYESLQKTGGKVYLQGVLQGYKPSNKRALTERCYTLSQMKKTRYGRTVNGHYWSGIWWPASCESGWKQRYDIEVTYVPDESPVTINYYQWYNKKWNLVASVTNCKEGRIEKTSSGAYFTRNINSGSNQQWQSTDTSAPTIAEGRGLGLKGNGKLLPNGTYDYNGLYYYGRKPLSTSAKTFPARLSGVVATGSENTKGDLSKYYLYATRESKVNSKYDKGARKAASGTHTVAYKKTDRYVTKSGEFTESYKNWLPTARHDFAILNGGTVISAFYKKQADPPDDEEEEDSISSSHLTPNVAKAIIQADNRGNEAFDSTQGIPTTETQYVNVVADKYLYKYRFTRKYGEKSYSEYTYCTHTEYVIDPTTGKKVKDPITGEYQTQQSHSHDSKTVKRQYSYWKVTSLTVYKIKDADVENYSLPNETITLTPGASYSAPNVSLSSDGGIVSEPSDGWTVGQIEVKNDTLVVNGTTVMNGSVCTKATSRPGSFPAPASIDYDALYKCSLGIDATKTNGVWESDATVTYVPCFNYGGSSDEIEIDITEINDVTIHTPTVCYPSISDAKSYTQLVSPGTDCYHLVLDRTFYVSLPTSGYHSALKGYGTRDYAKYIASREVCFPFDVYMINSSGGYTYYAANSWIGLSQQYTQFYLPIWVNETGSVGIDFRTKTINCDANNGSLQEENEANTLYENYVATSTLYAEVSGRIYGLNVYDISDYPIWQLVFRNANSLQRSGQYYSIGLNDQNGTQKRTSMTLPIVNGDNPVARNMGTLKTGYTARMSLTTIGNMYHGTDSITLKPRFFYVSYDGTKREEVDLYYNGTIQGKYRKVVKVGSKLDEKNVKSMTLGSPYTAVPDKEIQAKAKIANLKEKDILAATSPVYTYGKITIPSKLSTYIGTGYAPTGIIPNNVEADDVTRSMQRWYFEYSLPSDVHAVSKGFDVDTYAHEHNGIDYKEDFWKKNGYIVVNFDVVSYETGFDKFQVGADTGDGWLEGADVFEEVTSTPLPRLSYINVQNVSDGYCNMWQLEGFRSRRTDFEGNIFNFRYGDTLMYYLDQSAQSDYRSYGTH